MPRTLIQKVTLAALIFLALTASAGWIAIVNIRTTGQATNDLTEHIVQESYLNGQFEAAVFRAISEAVSFVHTGDPEFRQEAYEVLDRLRNDSAALDALDAPQAPLDLHDDRQAGLHKNRHAFVNRLEQTIDQLFQAVADNHQPAIEQRLGTLKDLEDQIEMFDQEMDEQLDHTRSSSNVMVDTLIQRSIYGTTISFALFAFMVVFALILLHRQIVQPIKQISAAAGIVASGDLEQYTPVTSHDEIGELQRSFNRMVNSLRDQRAAFEERAAAEQARASAEQANRAKSAFLANMSHELRTPLSAIIGYSELLVNTAREPAQLALLPDIQKIQQAGRHLLTLINDILDLSKIEAGKLQLAIEPFDVAALIDEIAATVQPLVAEHGNRLEVRCPADIGVMRSDPTKLRQVLLNLLGNAAKFTEGGTITLRVRLADQPPTTNDQRPISDDDPAFVVRRSSLVVFEVEDTGIGMSAEQLKKLFQPFTQASAATSRLYGGTGLGLTLSRHLARMLGGDIAVTSELGQGSTFTLTLPAQLSAAETAAPSSAPVLGEPRPAPSAPVLGEPRPTGSLATPTGDRMVLVIDDDPTARELIARSLDGERVTVVTASSGEEGLELARDLLPEVIVLDVLMSGMDGWSVLVAIKSDPELAGIPVIMLTIIDERDTGFALGASDYLIKPVERERLLEVMREYRLSTPARPARAAGRIMIVDDDAMTRELLRRTLAGSGCAIDEAAGGAEALARLATCAPDLYLIDLMLPDMDGVELINAIRAAEGEQTTPIVVITGKDLSRADRERLSDTVTRILEKGHYRSEQLLHEAQQLIALHLRHDRADTLEEIE